MVERVMQSVLVVGRVEANIGLCVRWVCGGSVNLLGSLMWRLNYADPLQ